MSRCKLVFVGLVFSGLLAVGTAHAVPACMTGPGLVSVTTVCDANAPPGVPLGPHGDYNAGVGSVGFFFASGGWMTSGSFLSPVAGAPLSMTLTGTPAMPAPVAVPSFFAPPGAPLGTATSMWIASSGGEGTLRFTNVLPFAAPATPAVIMRTVTGQVYFPTATGSVNIELSTEGPIGGVLNFNVANPGVAGALVPFTFTNFTNGTIGGAPGGVTLVGNLTARFFDGPASVFLPMSADVRISTPRGPAGGGLPPVGGLGGICTITILGEDKCYTYLGSDVLAAPGGGFYYLKYLENTGDVVIGPDAPIAGAPDNHADHWEAEHPTHAGIHDELFRVGGVSLFDNDYATSFGFDGAAHVDGVGAVQNSPILPHNYFWYGLGDGPDAAANGGWQPGQTIVLGFFDPQHGPGPTPWGGAVVGSTGTGLFSDPSQQTINPAVVSAPAGAALLLTGLVCLSILRRNA